jgi:hypothetical protein
MRQHRLGVAAREEGRAKMVEAHLVSLAESRFNVKGACVVPRYAPGQSRRKTHARRRR